MFAMNTPNDEDRLLTIKDIMRLYGLSYWTIQRTLQSGAVPNTLKYSARGGYRVRKSDWDRYAKARWGLRVQQSEPEQEDAQK